MAGAVPAGLIIAATKPCGRAARMLAELGVGIVPVEEDEGNVDRYICGERLAVERRSGSSFLRGVQEKTLFTSAIYLREHFSLPVLIVEGEVNFEYSGFAPQAIRGALSSMMLEYGLSVLSTPTIEETVQLVAMMARQEQVGIPEISLIPKRKATTVPDMQRRVVEMLPGCGMVMARDLLQTFGTVERIVRASPEELRTVRGLGTRKAAEMHRVLHEEYASVDTERDLEDAIEAAPELLFSRPVSLLARQHHIYTDSRERHVVDLVFVRQDADEVILVELKRGRLAHEHVRQIRRYLDHASESKLLRPFLQSGTAVRGVLATIEDCQLKVRDRDVAVRTVDRADVTRVLADLRARRLAAMGMA